MQIRIVHREIIDDEHIYRIGESDWDESWIDDTGTLFKALQKEHGRCRGKVFIDVAVAFYPPKPKHVGLVFLKRKKYIDSQDTYLHETWVMWRPYL